MTSTILCIDQLRLSDLNVRTNVDDANDTASLEASILAEGLLQPLSVHPMPDDLYGVFAGGRRYRSIRNLVDRDALAADWPVSVVIHVDALPVELVARSLDENLLRRDLRPYEEYAALARERDLGRPAEQLATRHGQTLRWVRQALRLGDLSPVVFAAFEAGRISGDQAAAFGATGDQDLQLAAWEALRDAPKEARTPEAIRRWLRVDDREAGRLIRFVGEEPYRAAGGGWEVDLFDDGADGRGRVTDDKLLRRLADEKIAALKVHVREITARPDLRFAPKPPQTEYGTPDHVLLVTPKATIARLEDSRFVPESVPLPEGDIVAVIDIPESGEPDVTYWWASRKAYNASGRAPRALTRAPARPVGRVGAGAAIGHQYDGSRQKADAIIKEEAGLTREGIDVLRSIRRSILRAGIIRDAREDGTLGRDLLVWSQLRMLVSTRGDAYDTVRQGDIGMRRISDVDGDPEAATAQIGATEAGQSWAKAIAELKSEPFLSGKDLGRAFSDFRAAPQVKRDLAAAVVTGLALERSLDAEGYGVEVHDVVAIQAKLGHPTSIRRWWAPSLAFLRLLPRTEQLAIVEPMMERVVFGTWQWLKVDELLPHVLKVVSGRAISVRKSMARAAADWVHPLLAFRPPGGRTLAEVYEAEDAA